MLVRRVLKLLGLVLLAVSFSAPSHSATKKSGAEMQEPPDHELAVRSEFERVKAKNTTEDYERFIRRHPGHPLTVEARKALLRLRQQ